MLIKPHDIQVALREQGMQANETELIGLSRVLLLKGQANFYQEFDGDRGDICGRFRVKVLRDPKGRIAVTKPVRVA